MNGRYKVRRTVIISTVLLITGLALAAWGENKCDDPLAVFSLLRGDVVHVDAWHKSLGRIRGGKKATATFALTNLHSEPVVLIGMNSTCACLTTAKMPVEIGPGESCDFPVDFYSGPFGTQDLDFEQQVTLVADRDGPPIVLRISGTIVPPASVTVPQSRDEGRRVAADLHSR